MSAWSGEPALAVISVPMHGEDNRRYPLDGWHALGLMSGTSVDGLDVVSARFTLNPDNTWSHRLEAFTTLPYPEALRSSLWNAMSLSAESLARLDAQWGRWAGAAVASWMAENGVGTPDVVGSHGHTVFHRPEEGWTHQIGSGADLHAALDVPVVGDLRSLDVALGGQGAPLVPLADQALFGAWDVALNLGGFANLSLEHPQHGRIAWDVGPANLLLNMVVGTRGLDMDRDGKGAAEGTVLPVLLEAWKRLEHHAQVPPKSLGREWLEGQVWPHAQKALEQHIMEDVLATVVAYAAWAVARDVPDGANVLVTGGGALNPTLMKALEGAVKGRQVVWDIPERNLIEGKEALVFAWLGLLRWLDMPNAISSVTGATKASSGGALWGPGPGR